MLDQFLLASYRKDREKNASRALIDKLKQLPMEELSKLASGGQSKLAYLSECGATGGGDNSWLSKYKGTELFQKAVELEKQLLQLDMEEQAERAGKREEDMAQRARWDARDALRFEQRMLDLDLAISQSGGGGAEQQEEQGVQLLEQAQAAERAQGEGGEPHEQAEDKAIQQFRQAQSEEAAAKTQEKPKEEKPKGGMSVEVKSAEAKVASAVAAGRLFAKTAKIDTPITLGAAGLGALGGAALTRGSPWGAGIGALGAGLPVAQLTHAASQRLAPHEVPGEYETNDPAALHAEAQDLRSAANTVRENPGKTRVMRGVVGGLGGAGLGAALGGLAGKPGAGALLGAGGGALLAAARKPTGEHLVRGAEDIEGYLAKRRELLAPGGAKTAEDLTQTAREKIKPKNFAMPKADGPGDTGKYPIHDRTHAKSALGLVGMHGSSEEKAKVRAAVAKKYPGLVEKKAFLGAAMKAVPGVLSGAKNLAQTAHAAGGIPQVAKSFGNVATQFAQKNPLTAAATAGGAGLLAGRALAPSPVPAQR